MLWEREPSSLRSLVREQRARSLPHQITMYVPQVGSSYLFWTDRRPPTLSGFVLVVILLSWDFGQMLLGSHPLESKQWALNEYVYFFSWSWTTFCF
jgi:hypothetical protein